MKTKLPAKDRPLTYKQKAFIKEVIDNPKQSLTQAAIKAYSREGKQVTYGSARQIAHDNMTKPNIVSKLSQYSDLVEDAILNTVDDWKRSDKVSERALAMDSAKFVHDKIHGKATQRVEVQSQQVSININMTQGQEPTGTDNVAQ